MAGAYSLAWLQWLESSGGSAVRSWGGGFGRAERAGGSAGQRRSYGQKGSFGDGNGNGGVGDR
jgi:hypothetical protein